MAARLLSPIRRLRTGQKLVLIFAGTVLLPGLVLAFSGLRTLLRESRLIDEDIRKDLSASAELVGRGVETELAAWLRTVEDARRESAGNSAAWPARLRAATAEPGSAVVLLRQGSQVRAAPPDQVLFGSFPGGTPETTRMADSDLAEIEALEQRSTEFHRAIELYRAILARIDSSAATERTIVLHRLARSLKKAGRTDEALRVFRTLEKQPTVRLGSLPSDLVAGYEILTLESRLTGCAECPGNRLQLFARLASGRWQLDKPSYAFYSERVRRSLPDVPLSQHWRDLESRKLALSQAVESYLDNPRPLLLLDGTYWLALSRPDLPDALILGERFLRTRVWPVAFGETSERFGIALLTHDRKLLYGSRLARPDRPVVEYPLHTAPRMMLEVWPFDPASMYTSRRMQQTQYAAMLGFVVLLLVFGAYLSVHTIRTELRMAQLKQDFVATVSHEFRSPLAGLLQLVEMLNDGRVVSEGRRRHYYRLITVEARRLQRLVENVLDFSRMQDGQKRYAREPFAPTPWLHGIVTEAEAATNGADVRITAVIPESLPDIVGDREALSTAVHNLIDNAVKYSGQSKVVDFSAEWTGTGLLIAVRDRGVGIKEEDAPHVFERFFRGSGESSRNVKGAGLGLSLVKHIVEGHGGSVSFESREGEGTVFTVLLPAGNGM